MPLGHRLPECNKNAYDSQILESCLGDNSWTRPHTDLSILLLNVQYYREQFAHIDSSLRAIYSEMCTQRYLGDPEKNSITYPHFRHLAKVLRYLASALGSIVPDSSVEFQDELPYGGPGSLGSPHPSFIEFLLGVKIRTKRWHFCNLFGAPTWYMQKGTLGDKEYNHIYRKTSLHAWQYSIARLAIDFHII